MLATVRDSLLAHASTFQPLMGISYDVEAPRWSLAVHRFGLSRRFVGLWNPSLRGSAWRTAADPKLYSGMKWRNIGPFRAGRVASVTGVIGQPGVFYMGLPAGGVWKTTSAGTTWFPVFDDVKEVGVRWLDSGGAVYIPNVIYAGTGDLVQGGAINEGNGVYKSADAGKSWQHLPGLENTKNIPALLVDPKDPSRPYRRDRGTSAKRANQRGVFRTTDGGTTWTRTLAIDDEIGAQSIAWAFDNPKSDARHDDPSLHVARRARCARRKCRRRPRCRAARRPERDINLQIDR